MHVAVAFALLLQQPAAPASFPVAKVEITPSVAEVEVGQRVQLSARAFDASGQPVRNATIEWFVASDVGSVDSTGLESGDRKSTRLNSSHGYISYAVFCLKKKKKKRNQITDAS